MGSGGQPLKSDEEILKFLYADKRYDSAGFSPSSHAALVSTLTALPISKNILIILDADEEIFRLLHGCSSSWRRGRSDSCALISGRCSGRFQESCW